MFRALSTTCSGVRRILVRCLIVALATMAPVWVPSLRAQSAPAYASEAVRALFLINFLGFTDWPADTLPQNTPYVIGVAGSRALEEELLALAEKRLVRDRRIRVVRVKNSRDLAGCHLLYVSPFFAPGDENSPTAGELLPLVRRQPVLTVSSSSTFLQEGGIVNLVAGDQGRLHFEISTNNAKEAGLVLSSRLLALARIVNPSPADGGR